MPQSLRDHAAKNGLVVADRGPCQLCGAPVERGVEECDSLFAAVQGRARADPSAGAGMIVVDAHALQHSEIHGRVNDHYHLLSLCLTIVHGRPDAPHPRIAPILHRKDLPVLGRPPMLRRGAVTVADVAAAEDFGAAARAWGRAVWDAWSDAHGWVRQTLDALEA